jgi:hypothetical protein
MQEHILVKNIHADKNNSGAHFIYLLSCCLRLLRVLTSIYFISCNLHYLIPFNFFEGKI